MSQMRISDITMKQSGKDFSLSFKEKLEIPKLLDKLGVAVIELEGKYYMYVSTMPNESDDVHEQYIQVAVCDTPDGNYQ